MNKVWGVVLAIVGGFAIGGIALHRHEPINALWIVTAAVCIYLLGYRFYAAWIAARVLQVDRDAGDAGGAAEQRPRLRAHAPRDRLRPSLRRHRRSRAAGRADARRAVRLPARDAVDPRRRGVRRLRAGHDDAAAVHAPRRPQPRADGAR